MLSCRLIHYLIINIFFFFLSIIWFYKWSVIARWYIWFIFFTGRVRYGWSLLNWARNFRAYWWSSMIKSIFSFRLFDVRVHGMHSRVQFRSSPLSLIPTAQNTWFRFIRHCINVDWFIRRHRWHRLTVKWFWRLFNHD
jgi:hypothetical protein